ncbi:hypothetical protein Pd630_LPD11085 (plasmid) [Rhodococcus opacus PD630]|nr:hypothetical protein Pd630_LPD11085 [Rhodococcus opacus PD630]
MAAPIQGGVTGGSNQEGVTGADTQGGTTTSTPAPEAEPAYVPEAPAEPEYWVEPPAAYQDIEWRALPNYDYENDSYVTPDDYDVAPVQVQELHLPTAVAPTAPIIAPRDTLRIGEMHIKQPNWITDEDKDRTNNTFAVVESGVSTAWRSMGVETDRADRIAAAQVGAGAAGATVGALTAGATAATAGALVGGTIGGIAGMDRGHRLPPWNWMGAGRHHRHRPRARVSVPRQRVSPPLLLAPWSAAGSQWPRSLRSRRATRANPARSKSRTSTRRQ